MAAVKTGVTLKLGLFSFSVDVESAISEVKETSFNNLCVGVGDAHDPTRIRQSNKCPVCDNDDKATFVKGKEQGKGQYVIVPPEELAKLEAGDDVKKSLDVTTHPSDDLSGVLATGKVYFLTPNTQAANEAYALLVALIQKRDQVAFVTEFAVRTVPAMYQITVHDGALMLRELARPELVKAVPNVPHEYNEAMLAMGDMFVNQLLTPFDPTRYSDKRTQIIAEFMATQTPVTATTVEDGPAQTPQYNLEAMLKAALEAAGAPVPEQAPAPKAPAKKAAAKKAVAVKKSA